MGDELLQLIEAVCCVRRSLRQLRGRRRILLLSGEAGCGNIGNTKASQQASGYWLKSTEY